VTNGSWATVLWLILYNLEYINFSKILEKLLNEKLAIFCGENFVFFLINRFEYSVFQVLCFEERDLLEI